jgi:DNA-binding NtrC family response regulator
VSNLKKIIIFEDPQSPLGDLSKLIDATLKDAQVHSFQKLETAKEYIKKNKVELAFLDFSRGEESLSIFNCLNEDTVKIIVGEVEDTARIVELVKSKALLAHQYLFKPFGLSRFREKVSSAMERKALEKIKKKKVD